MELAMRKSLDAIESDPKAFIGMGSLDGGRDFFLRVRKMKHKKNILRYLDLFCNGDQETEERDMRKLKITTYLLHMNDIPHLGDDFANKVWEYDLGVHFDTIQQGHNTFYFEKAIYQDMKDVLIRQCDYCGKVSLHHQLLKCGACKVAYFCNEQCQKALWPLHKLECKCNYSTKSELLHSKQGMTWKLFLCRYGKEILGFFNHVETHCGKKSKILLLTNVVHSHDEVNFQFRTVSMRLFTSYKQNVMDFIDLNNKLKARSDVYLLAIPYNGGFNCWHMFA